MEISYKDELEHLSMKMEVLKNLYRSEHDKQAKKLIKKMILELSGPLEKEEKANPAYSQKFKKRESNKKARILAWLIPIAVAVMCVISFFDAERMGTLNEEFCTYLTKSEFGMYAGLIMCAIAVIVIVSTRKSGKDSTIIDAASIIFAAGGMLTFIGGSAEVSHHIQYNFTYFAGYTLTNSGVAFIIGLALLLVGSIMYAAIIAANHKNGNEYLK